MNKPRSHKSVCPDVVRCAIYTRKSTEEGLEQEFNTLDAQRESGEAYIKSQQHEGWECLPDRYDDGGFTGGNMDRPALKRLISGIEAGRINCVVVYKVDRLSRSLLDFSRLLEVFDRHEVAFVSVTQPVNTTTSMGRLTMNMLLSFAQFEREIISERTRDKIAAARRKGKWSGGMPILGYDVDPNGSKLVVNKDEAIRVKAIFAMYLEHQSLLETVKQLNGRGWNNKRWTTRKGIERGGKLFTKTSLQKLLTNVTYTGKIKYKDEVHEGEHDGIVDPEIWQRVQSVLKLNSRNGGAAVRNKFGALLKGILNCTCCNCSMSPTHSTRKGNKRYRYYVCTNAQKRGWDNCPSKSIPAGEIEQFVVDQIRCIGRDPELMAATIEQIKDIAKQQIDLLVADQRLLKRELAKWNREVQELVGKIGTENGSSFITQRLTELNEQIQSTEQRLISISTDLDQAHDAALDESQVEKALAAFDPVWDSLTLREQCRIIQLLIERVDYDGESGRIAITFHPTGIKSLNEELESK